MISKVPSNLRPSTDETIALEAELPSVFLQLREISLSCLLLGGENYPCNDNKCCQSPTTSLFRESEAVWLLRACTVINT